MLFSKVHELLLCERFLIISIASSVGKTDRGAPAFFNWNRKAWFHPHGDIEVVSLKSYGFATKIDSFAMSVWLERSECLVRTLLAFRRFTSRNNIR